MKKPNFFIVGAPKCGTTALSEYLKEHPNIYVSSPKEPHYFAEDFNRSGIATLEQYAMLFKESNDYHFAIGEASTHYLCSAVALKNIYQFHPQAKIIAMLRNPVDLVYSYHSQLVYNAGEEESNFEKAWHLQSERLAGNCIPPRCRNPKVLQYKLIGQLGSQVENLFSIFPQQQVKLILFDDFKIDTAKVYEDVLRFLNVPLDNRTEFPRINANKSHRIAALSVLTNQTPRQLVSIREVFKKIFGVKSFGILAKVRQLNSQELSRPSLNESFRLELINEFADEVEKLSIILNRDLSHWNR